MNVNHVIKLEKSNLIAIRPVFLREWRVSLFSQYRPTGIYVDGKTLYMLQLVLIMENMDIEPQKFGFYQEQQECTSVQQSMEIQIIALTVMLYLYKETSITLKQ